ncbi:hypothetical protein ABZ904_44620 [Streptomyces sp. NPDC046900]|uniref:hypothetical protein n=1 Tax=Streptomyces sp. NPDC046900 TaxID=3155473 RepID=UPI0033E63A97
MADLDELRRQVALGCRVLAATDTTTPLLGHVSSGWSTATCSYAVVDLRSWGLLFTEAADIRGVGLDDTGEVGDGYSPTSSPSMPRSSRPVQA